MKANKTIREAVAQAEREGRIVSKVPFKSTLAERQKRASQVVPDHQLPTREGWITLPWPPSVNSYWRTVNGITMLSAEARAYHKRCADLVFMQMVTPPPRQAFFSHGERLRVTVLVFQPDHRKRDLDNLNKAVLDSCAKSWLFGDDSQIDKLTIERRQVSRAMPRVEVLIEEIPEGGLFTEESE